MFHFHLHHRCHSIYTFSLRSRKWSNSPWQCCLHWNWRCSCELHLWQWHIWLLPLWGCWCSLSGWARGILIHRSYRESWLWVSLWVYAINSIRCSMVDINGSTKWTLLSSFATVHIHSVVDGGNKLLTYNGYRIAQDRPDIQWTTFLWKKAGIDLMQSHQLHWKNILQTIPGLIGCIGWEMHCYLMHKVQSGGWLLTM